MKLTNLGRNLVVNGTDLLKQNKEFWKNIKKHTKRPETLLKLGMPDSLSEIMGAECLTALSDLADRIELKSGISPWLENSFQTQKFDAALVLGDRYEIFSCVISATLNKIPIAHIHGGDKTQGCIDEYNRHAISKLSNIHFAATKKSMERILKMGENPKNVFNVGSPSICLLYTSPSPRD